MVRTGKDYLGPDHKSKLVVTFKKKKKVASWFFLKVIFIHLLLGKAGIFRSNELIYSV